MKLEELRLTESSSNVYHLTEQSNVANIMKKGLIPASSMRGMQYKDSKLHVIRSLNEDTVDEVMALILFGGQDMDNEEERQDIPIAIIEIDVDALQQHDHNNRINRTWKVDPHISENQGAFTMEPIPSQVLTPIKTINT